MGDAGRRRAEEFSWPRVTAKVDDFYGFVIRRLAARGELPPGLPRRDPALATPRRARRDGGAADPGVMADGSAAETLPDPVTAGPGLGAPPED